MIKRMLEVNVIIIVLNIMKIENLILLGKIINKLMLGVKI